MLEILLGSVLFATTLVYLAGIWGVHARTVGHTRDRMVASFIAGQQIENCITAGFRGVDLMASSANPPQLMTSTINGVEHKVSYSYTIEVERHPDPLLRDTMKTVTVRVQFVEQSKIGGKGEVVYRTILTDV